MGYQSQNRQIMLRLDFSHQTKSNLEDQASQFPNKDEEEAINVWYPPGRRSSPHKISIPARMRRAIEHLRNKKPHNYN